MSYKKSLRGAAQYIHGTSRESEITEGGPYRVTQILMETLLGRLAAAKGAIERKDDLEKTQASSRALAIITELRTALDFDQGKEVAVTLNSLYDYMGVRLMQSVAANDASMVEEVINLMKPVKEGWDGIQEVAEKVLAERASS